MAWDGWRLKSNQGYQQGLWEQTDLGRGAVPPPTSWADLGELLSRSGGVSASKGT